MKICSKPNRFPVKWLCTAGFRAKKLIFVVGLKVLQNNWETQIILHLGYKCWKNSRNLLHSVPDRGGAHIFCTDLGQIYIFFALKVLVTLHNWMMHFKSDTKDTINMLILTFQITNFLSTNLAKYVTWVKWNFDLEWKSVNVKSTISTIDMWQYNSHCNIHYIARRYLNTWLNTLCFHN